MRPTLAPTIAFTSVDIRLARVKLITAAVSLAIPVIALVVLSLTVWRDYPWTWAFAAGLTLIAAWSMSLIPRRVRAMGYAELEDELLIRRGVVPYGRLQQVTVQAGPLMGRYGLASVTLVTAAASSNAEIPGVPAAEAERLRTKLTALGEANLEGL